jgi:hypothetical protein
VLFEAECPNGQGKDAFKFKALVAGRDNSFTVAFRPQCTELTFNTVGFSTGAGSRAKILLGIGSGRPAINFEVSDSTAVDVSCKRTIIKGYIWDDVTLTCVDVKNSRAVFVFAVK